MDLMAHHWPHGDEGALRSPARTGGAATTTASSHLQECWADSFRPWSQPRAGRSTRCPSDYRQLDGRFNRLVPTKSDHRRTRIINLRCLTTLNLDDDQIKRQVMKQKCCPHWRSWRSISPGAREAEANGCEGLGGWVAEAKNQFGSTPCIENRLV